MTVNLGICFCRVTKGQRAQHSIIAENSGKLFCSGCFDFLELRVRTKVQLLCGSLFALELFCGFQLENAIRYWNGLYLCENTSHLSMATPCRSIQCASEPGIMSCSVPLPPSQKGPSIQPSSIPVGTLLIPAEKSFRTYLYYKVSCSEY